jgi:hypothetical protein
MMSSRRRRNGSYRIYGFSLFRVNPWNSSSPMVRRLPSGPYGWTLSSTGGPCVSGASWSALRTPESVHSNEARRGVTGFGAFCRNKRASPAVAKPGNTENHVDTRIGDTSAMSSPPNAFLLENPKFDSQYTSSGVKGRTINSV